MQWVLITKKKEVQSGDGWTEVWAYHKNPDDRRWSIYCLDEGDTLTRLLPARPGLFSALEPWVEFEILGAS